MRESEKAWARYEAVCREGDKFRFAAVISLAAALILPPLAVALALAI